jgi:hypothetical protein
VTDTKKNRKSSPRRALPPGPEYQFDDETVPPPPDPRRGAYRIYFPFDVMEAGKSFKTKRTIGTVRDAARRFRREGHADQFVIATLALAGAKLLA